MPYRVVPLSGSWFRARFVVNTALIIACASMAIPYGPRDPHHYTHNGYFVYTLSGFAVVAGIGLIIDLISPKWARTDTAWPYIVVCWAFTAMAVYQGFDPGEINPVRISLFLVYFGAAWLAAGGWYLRRMNVRARYADNEQPGSW
jgi:hypothetical protein